MVAVDPGRRHDNKHRVSTVFDRRAVLNDIKRYQHVFQGDKKMDAYAVSGAVRCQGWAHRPRMGAHEDRGFWWHERFRPANSAKKHA
jgi:hypothetical protein